MTKFVRSCTAIIVCSIILLFTAYCNNQPQKEMEIKPQQASKVKASWPLSSRVKNVKTPKLPYEIDDAPDLFKGVRSFYIDNNGVVRIKPLLFDAFCPEAPRGFMNEPEGFRGLKWGTSRRDCKYLELINDGFYKNPNEDLIFENVPLESIIYEFDSRRFYSVTLIAGYTEENYNALQSALEKKHGQPTDEIDSTLRWCGKTGTIRLSNDDSVIHCSFSKSDKPHFSVPPSDRGEDD